MTRFIFDLAARSDEPQLRRIFEASPMDGDIRVSFLRRPDIFHSFSVLGESNQIIVARDTEKNTIAGFGIRSIRPMWVNGKLVDMGYLSSLRIIRDYQKGTLLGRGFRQFKKMHFQDDKVSLYLMAVIENNRQALRTLSSGRAGLPIFHDLGAICTLALDVRKKDRFWKSGENFQVCKGDSGNISEAIQFANEIKSARQFSPHISVDLLLEGSPLYRGLHPDDFFIAFDQGKIVGVAAKWDQSSFKQNLISGYSRKMNFIRPLYNMWAALTNRTTLPKAGLAIQTFFVTYIAVLDDDPRILRELLSAIRSESIGQGYSHMLVGFHEKDKLISDVLSIHPIQYRSRLMVGYWEDGRTAFENLTDLTPSVEIAML